MLCKRHNYNYSANSSCPLCASSNKRDGMQTPLWKIGGVHWQRTNGKALEGEDPLERPTVSRNRNQR